MRRLLTWLPSDGKTREQRMLRLGIGKDTREGIRKKLRARRATREHLVRIKDGGANARLNLVLACLECNSNRGDTPVKQWRNLRRKRKAGTVPMVQTARRSFGGQMTPDKSEFWKPRHCLREPLPEIYYAAHLLNQAVSAHLQNKTKAAASLIAEANIPEIRAWTESLWGSKKKNPEQKKYHRFRSVEGMPPQLSISDRPKIRMPSSDERRQLLEQYGRHCVFCGIPLISKQVRMAVRKLYPEALPWGKTNPEQHAAFQCMWLQFDHVVPHSRGGDSSIKNVVVTCAPCNYGRGERMLEELGLLDPRKTPRHKTSWDGLQRLLVMPNTPRNSSGSR